jgi:hypothetical protein
MWNDICWILECNMQGEYICHMVLLYICTMLINLCWSTHNLAWHRSDSIVANFRWLELMIMSNGSTLKTLLPLGSWFMAGIQLTESSSKLHSAPAFNHFKISGFVVLIQINNRTYLTKTSIPQKHTNPTLQVLTNLATFFYEMRKPRMQSWVKCNFNTLIWVHAARGQHFHRHQPTKEA